MSRDWKPFEQVIFDEEMYSREREYLHDMKLTVHLNNEDEGTPFYNEEARKEFPNLSFLLNNFELDTYPEIKNDKHGIIKSTYKDIEKEVGILSDTLRKQIKNNEKLNLDDIENNIPEKVKDWFMGELDVAFYYNEENNELFREYIEDRILNNMKSAMEDTVNKLNVCTGNPILKEIYQYLNNEISNRESKDKEDIDI